MSVTFCSHCYVFSWFLVFLGLFWLMGFCCFTYCRIESCGLIIMY